MKNKILALNIALFFALSACSDNHQNKLVGNWSTPCHGKAKLGFSFENDGTGSRSKSYYLTDRCEAKKLSRVETFDYIIGEPLQNNEAIRTLDISMKKVEIYEQDTLKSVEEISGNFYTIYEIDMNNNLHFGNDGDNNKDNRPTVINKYTETRLLTKH